MARRKPKYIYTFVAVQEKYQLTSKAEANLYHIERILGAVKVQGKSELFEKVEIKDRYTGFEGIFLTERKNLNFDVVEDFVTGYYNGVRSVQSHPYTDDLLDDDLLDDLDMTVLTYKHFYSMGGGLCDVYYPVKKEKATDELRQTLNQWTEEAISDKKTWDKCREEERRNIPIFEKL